MTDVEALEENLWEMHRDFARVRGAEVHDDPDLLWYTAPGTNGWLNGASRSVLGDDADERVRLLMEALAARRLPLMWHVTPSSRPADLAERLERAGFSGTRSPGMALDASSYALHTREELVVHHVASANDVLAWCDTFDRSFGVAPRGSNHPWLGVFADLGLTEGSPCRLFLGRVGGEPVATSLAFSTDETVGLYGVGTLPDRRGRGYGAALTGAGIVWGRERGARVAVLSATELGEPVYRRMGFATVCETSMWVMPLPS